MSENQSELNIYYAGLDNYSLPLGDGEKLISETSLLQIKYLKALCLVSDKIIVPPSFYLYWVGANKSRKNLKELADLYQAGFIKSAVHSSMASSSDFLKYKLEYGTKDDINLTKNNILDLDYLFSEMPLSKRDVTKQSGGFKEQIISDIEMSYKSSYYKEFIINSIKNKTSVNGVVASREEINNLHYSAYSKNKISKHELRQYYYTTNKCYYHQGAITYDGVISILDAHRYSILGKPLFESTNGILLGYDPQVIMGILNSFGITSRFIDNLSISEIRNIRESSSFQSFKSSYLIFSQELQKINLNIGNISKKKLNKIQELFRQEFMSQYFDQRVVYTKGMNKWAFSEMSVFSLALGGVGFFVIPVIGAALGALPIALWKSGVTPKIGGYVVDRLYENQTSFYTFIRELRFTANRIQSISDTI